MPTQKSKRESAGARIAYLGWLDSKLPVVRCGCSVFLTLACEVGRRMVTDGTMDKSFLVSRLFKQVKRRSEAEVQCINVEPLLT